MKRENNYVIKGALGLLLAFSVLLCLPAEALAQASAGPERTEKLVEHASTAVKRLEVGAAQIQATIDAYNAIIDDQVDDLKKAHKKLIDELDKTEKLANDYREKSKAMEQQASNFFAAWWTSLDEISSPGLKEKSRDRLNRSRIRYMNMVRDVRRGRADFWLLVDALREQAKYLSYNLNSSGVANLQSDAKWINGMANQLLGDIQQIESTFRRYVNSLRADT